MFAQESVMEIQKIKELALANGFSLKEQASGNMDLHSYVYEFANAIEQAAKAQAVPEGFVLVPKENISCYWQDNDEPENFCSNESDFDCLGDCIDLGEIMEINKFTQAHVNKEILFGTWFAEAIDPSEKANFFVGTHAECLEIVAKNKAMIEAQEPAND